MLQHRTAQRAALLILVTMLILSGCDAIPQDGPPGNAHVLHWVHSTSLSDWAAAATADFNSQRIKADDGRPIWIESTATDAGQTVSDMLGGETLPVLWTTADPQWPGVLAAEAGREVFLPNCISIAESPLVIAMWEPAARALGWPARTLGWLDVASLAADPSGWRYYSGGEWGDTLRISHAHPGLSDSGVQTLQALVHAAQSSTDSISAADVENPIVQASVGAFESAVAWFSTSTRLLRDTMLERGISYLSAGILYESDVVTQGQRSPQLVAIYPFEGTFIATFPTCVRAEMDDTTTRAAESFLAYLLDEPAQQLALQYGLRPVNDAVPVGAPVDAAHGADPTQPEQVFTVSSAETVFAIQDLWQSQRKNVNLTMVLDISGSMEGAKIELMRLSAIEFVRQMGEQDRLTVVVFDDYPRVLVPNTTLRNNQETIIASINTITAGGGTSLFDSLAFAAEGQIKDGRTDDANAMVVLTDGMDTASNRFRTMDAVLVQLIEKANTAVYTIAYGEDADSDTMRLIALATNGIAYEGDIATIGDIYAEISAAFGGSAGIGR